MCSRQRCSIVENAYQGSLQASIVFLVVLENTYRNTSVLCDQDTWSKLSQTDRSRKGMGRMKAVKIIEFIKTSGIGQGKEESSCISRSKERGEQFGRRSFGHQT